MLGFQRGGDKINRGSNMLLCIQLFNCWFIATVELKIDISGKHPDTGKSWKMVLIHTLLNWILSHDWCLDSKFKKKYEQDG